MSTSVPALPRLHPIGSLLRIIDLRPAIPGSQIIGMAIFLHHAEFMRNTTREQQLYGVRAELRPRRRIAFWRLAGQCGCQFDALVEDIRLLLAIHSERILVRISVNPDLVAILEDHLRCFRKALHRMTGDVPGGDNSVAPKHFQQPWHAAFRRKDAPRNIARGISTSERTNPQGNGIEMDIDTDLNILASGGHPHRSSKSRRRARSKRALNSFC